MSSENAKAVAQEVIQTVRKGQKVNKGDIIKKHGYSDSVSESPTKVTETQSYKEAIEPIVNRWQKEIARIQTELENRVLSGEKYKELVESLDKLNKQVQLATGGATERLSFIINPEDKEKALKALEAIE